MERASRGPWIEFEHNPRAMQLIEYTLKEFWDIFVDDRLCGKRSLGLFWMHGTVCVYAQPLRNGMSQGDTGRMASSSSSFF